MAGAAACLAAVVIADLTVPQDGATGADAPGDIAITHIHAALREPGNDQVLVATHQGIFTLDDAGEDNVTHHNPPTLHLISPMLDFMGLTRSPDGTLYASGHAGTDLGFDEPMGLITSADGGRTWEQRSRGGLSDFHGLGAGTGLIVGYDGELRHTTDATNWQDLKSPGSPTSLAVSPDGRTTAIVTSGELHLTQDTGRTWSLIETPDPITLVAFADNTTLLTTTAEGRLHRSDDAGRTWTSGETPIAPDLTYLSATRTGSTVDVLAVSDLNIFSTDDLGTTSRRLL
jgi:photosystem II stability/assembly factor-like uncharacterized protein